ncbi:MAG TPA: DUF2470 domain-containing protein [Tepidiformaceae bacterium]|nr:DUF2470 domain-containing protein [Tepidiformaceae bacterium]
MSVEHDIAFAPEESAAIMRHMNGDHADDSVLMVRALGGQSGASDARVVGIDKEGIDFAAVVDGADVLVRIPWGRRLSARSEVRGEVVRLYQESCAELGIEPRQAEQGAH